MKQEPAAGRSYAALLEPLRRDLRPLVDEVVRDVAPGPDDAAAVAEGSRRAVETTIARLLAAAGPEEPEAERLRSEGARSAREGEPLSRLLDRYLTAGWVVWEAATTGASDDPQAVASLGAALLRAGDTAAASLADGYAEAEREIAARAASARQEFVDTLLELPLGGPAEMRRILDRAAHFGLDASGSYRVVIAWLGRELEDEAPEVDALARAVARPGREGMPAGGPIVATKRGRLVLVARSGGRALDTLETELRRILPPQTWVAVESARADGLSAIGAAFADALASLEIAERLGVRGRRLPVGDLLLERALLADESIVAAAVEHELGPLLGAPRGSAALVETVSAYLASGHGIRATARRLGVAPRTVAYRLDRAATLLGGPIAGERAFRLAAALLARRLITPPIR
jgi:hypothetical protein